MILSSNPYPAHAILIISSLTDIGPTCKALTRKRSYTYRGVSIKKSILTSHAVHVIGFCQKPGSDRFVTSHAHDWQIEWPVNLFCKLCDLSARTLQVVRSWVLFTHAWCPWLAGCIISNVVQLPQREGRMHARGYNMTEIHTIWTDSWSYMLASYQWRSCIGRIQLSGNINIWHHFCTSAI
jgi:hypothetical protein